MPLSSSSSLSPDAAAVPSWLQVHDLGRMRYAEAFALQKQMQEQVITQREGSGEMHLLLVEHDPPVITVSRRPSARQHLIATPQQLEAAGVEVAETDRGGDITYHGPGQLVVYPILDLNRLGLRLHGYMRFLEQIVIDVLARFGIEGHRDENATGVWVRHHDAGSGGHQASPHAPLPQSQSTATAASAKICAMGVRVSRWVSMHGLALNVTTNLQHFNLIVPCGLADRGVTSMHQQLGERCPSMDEVKRAMVQTFGHHVGAAEGKE